MEAASVRFAEVNIDDILKTLPHRYPMLLITAASASRT
jgi:3-hydroxymyristoyl/3-hydroxydecanoyl-(acyl carrier protein) dehydratase